jgi:DNA repair protein RAD50
VSLKHQASQISKIQQDVSRLKKEISEIEMDLRSTGSTKTNDEVQAQIDVITNDL